MNKNVNSLLSFGYSIVTAMLFVCVEITLNIIHTAHSLRHSKHERFLYAGRRLGHVRLLYTTHLYRVMLPQSAQQHQMCCRAKQ